MPRNADMLQNITQKDPAQIPTGSCCRSILGWRATLDVMAMTSLLLRKCEIRIYLYCPQDSPLPVCLSVCFSPLLSEVKGARYHAKESTRMFQMNCCQ